MPPITFSDIFGISLSLALSGVCIYALIGLRQSMKELRSED